MAVNKRATTPIPRTAAAPTAQFFVGAFPGELGAPRGGQNVLRDDRRG